MDNERWSDAPKCSHWLARSTLQRRVQCEDQSFFIAEWNTHHIAIMADVSDPEIKQGGLSLLSLTEYRSPLLPAAYDDVRSSKAASTWWVSLVFR